jgi:iron(III) transport system permease protein
MAVAAVLGNALLGPVMVLGWWVGRGLIGGGANGAGVAKALDDAGIGDLIVPAANTAGISVVAALATVAAILPVAYLTGRYRSRVGEAANALVVGGFALPGLVIAFAIGYWAVRSPGSSWLYQSYPLLVAAYVMHFGAQSMRASQVAVAAVPRRLEDAARMLGADRWRRLRTIEVPLMLPGLGAGAGLVLLSVMKELPATHLLSPLGFETLATEVWGAANEGYLARAGMGSLVLVALSGVLTWVLVVRRSERFD